MLTKFLEDYKSTFNLDSLRKLTYQSNVLQHEREYVDLVADRDDLQDFICEGFMIAKWERDQDEARDIYMEGSFLSLQGRTINFLMTHYAGERKVEYEHNFELCSEEYDELYLGEDFAEWYRPIRKELGIPKTYLDHGRLMWTLRLVLGMVSISGWRRDSEMWMEHHNDWDSDQWSSDEEGEEVQEDAP